MLTVLRRWSRIVVLPLGLLLVLSACSSPDDESSSSGGAYTPVTIAHQYGSTTIDALPQRVITVGGNWTDTLVALDVPIVAEYRLFSDGAPAGKTPWTPDHKSEVINVNSTADVDLTKLAAFKPDVILAGYLGSKAIYDQLSKLAPTIPVISKEAVMDTWQELTTTGGKIFAKSDKATELIKGVDDKLGAFKQKYPAAQGKTFTFGTATPEGQIGVVTNAKDPSSLLLAQMGLRLDPGVASVSGSKSGRAFISPERMDVLSSDLLLMWIRQGSPESLATKLPGWSELKSVKGNTVTYLDNTSQAAFNYPSILSVPYAITLVEPAAANFK
ncbi:ABC transporter substrate-binding protein [Gordonia sp. CPCC 205333]|uniref:ABC transporter substrate-binding protein n=1 Tax=Gordonia sp. CPCC 205333 TaxID=3140790 RepID=UPI003AF3366D